MKLSLDQKEFFNKLISTMAIDLFEAMEIMVTVKGDFYDFLMEVHSYVVWNCHDPAQRNQISDLIREFVNNNY